MSHLFHFVIWFSKLTTHIAPWSSKKKWIPLVHMNVLTTRIMVEFGCCCCGGKWVGNISHWPPALITSFAFLWVQGCVGAHNVHQRRHRLLWISLYEIEGGNGFTPSPHVRGKEKHPKFRKKLSDTNSEMTKIVLLAVNLHFLLHLGILLLLSITVRRW